MSAAWAQELVEVSGEPVAFCKREGTYRQGVKHLYECKDGYVNWFPVTGPLGAKSIEATLHWAQEEGYPRPRRRLARTPHRTEPLRLRNRESAVA